MLKILIATLTVLAVVFSLQNMTPVSVTFIIWQFQSPLAFVLLGAVAVGSIIASLVLGPSVVRRGFAISAGKRQISDLEHKLESAHRQAKENAALLSSAPDHSHSGGDSVR